MITGTQAGTQASPSLTFDELVESLLYWGPKNLGTNGLRLLSSDTLNQGALDQRYPEWDRRHLPFKQQVTGLGSRRIARHPCNTLSQVHLPLLAWAV